MKKVKHWLHILLTLLTGGLWLPVYVIVIATTEMFNRGYREGKAAGRVEKSNEYEAVEFEKRVHGEQGNKALFFGSVSDTSKTFSGLGEVSVHREKVVGVDGATYGFVETIESTGAKIQRYVAGEKSRVDRFAELADRNRSVGLDTEERREYFALRQELSR